MFSGKSKTNRRDFLKAVGLGAVALGGFGCVPKSANKPTLAGSRPNIVLIMSDDMGAYNFSCYGNPKATQTPNIDALAKGGVQFRTAFSTSLCTPSRAMLMTGKYATRTGIYGNWGDYNVKTDEFYKHDIFLNILRDSGYRTAIAGKWDNGFEFGKDWGDWDKKDVRGADQSRIWCRDTRFVPKDQKYEGETVQYGDHFDATRYWQPLILQNGKYHPTTKEDYAPDMFCEFLSDFFKSSKGTGKPFMAYYPMVLPHGDSGMKNPQPQTPEPGKNLMEYVDVAVGKIVKSLDENGLRENTIIIFTSDNGSGAPPRGKNTSCEPAFSVPLIVNCPGKIPARGIVDEMASLADVLPTMAELASAKLQQEIDGISFVPVLEGKAGNRDYLFSYVAGERIIRDRRWLWEEIHESREGTFWDCGNVTAGSSHDDPNKFYKNVTDSKYPEVLAAKARFEKILQKYPAPKGVPFSWAARRDATLKKWYEKTGQKPKTYEKSKYTK